MARVMLGVKGMNTKERMAKVEGLLLEVEGITRVRAQMDQQVAVEYNEQEITTMDIIRPLRNIGLTAGMV